MHSCCGENIHVHVRAEKRFSTWKPVLQVYYVAYAEYTVWLRWGARRHTSGGDSIVYHIYYGSSCVEKNLRLALVDYKCFKIAWAHCSLRSRRDGSSIWSPTSQSLWKGRRLVGGNNGKTEKWHLFQALPRGEKHGWAWFERTKARWSVALRCYRDLTDTRIRVDIVYTCGPRWH